MELPSKVGLNDKIWIYAIDRLARHHQADLSNIAFQRDLYGGSSPTLTDSGAHGTARPTFRSIDFWAILECRVSPRPIRVFSGFLLVTSNRRGAETLRACLVA